MRRRALQLAALGLLLLAVLVVSFVLRPLWWFERFGKLGLRSAGLARAELAAPRGTLVYWKGGAGETLVLLHGANDQAGGWARIAKPLLRGRRLVVPDLPGHGESAPQDGSLAVSDLLAGVEALVDAEAGAGQVTLLGNSLGGYVAMLYARRHPQRVAQVILVNGAAVRAQPGADVSLLPTSREEARRAFAAVLDPGSPAVPWYILDDVVRRGPRSPLARLLAQPIDAALVLDGRLAEFQLPVTLLWGESDRYLSVEYAQALLGQLPAARLERLSRCGHIPQRECPERLVPLVEQALAAPPRPRSD